MVELWPVVEDLVVWVINQHKPAHVHMQVQYMVSDTH